MNFFVTILSLNLIVNELKLNSLIQKRGAHISTFQKNIHPTFILAKDLCSHIQGGTNIKRNIITLVKEYNHSCNKKEPLLNFLMKRSYYYG